MLVKDMEVWFKTDIWVVSNVYFFLFVVRFWWIILQADGWIVEKISLLANPNQVRPKRFWGVYTKLKIFNMTKYKKGKHDFATTTFGCLGNWRKSEGHGFFYLGLV